MEKKQPIISHDQSLALREEMRVFFIEETDAMNIPLLARLSRVYESTIKKAMDAEPITEESYNRIRGAMQRERQAVKEAISTILGARA